MTPDGVVKLLDFGLAKALAEESITFPSDPTASPAPTPATTGVGVILGTASYMSPEQAKGKRLDRRTDIWSWGVMLYELLTGRQLFRAETAAETIAQVLTVKPDLTPAPAKVRKLLQSCLEKDPKWRLRDIGDAVRMLDDVAEVPALARSIVPWVLCAMVAIVAAVFAVLWFIRPAQLIPDVRYEITLEGANRIQSFAISPDGRYVAFAAEAGGTRQLWVRTLGALQAQPLANTEDASSPFWSPDSRQIGFFAQGALKKISASGGPPGFVV